MEYKELRIGNWVIDKGDDTKTPIEVVYITEDNTEWLEPIPLTEDWLIKFGFQLMTKRSCKYMMKDRNDEPCFFFCKNKVRYQNTYIKHLHQLQNLYFALKGEELIIKE